MATSGLSISDEVQRLWRSMEDGVSPSRLRNDFDSINQRGPFIREHLKSLGPRGADALWKFDQILVKIEQLEAAQNREKEDAIIKRRQRIRELAEPLFRSDFLNADTSFDEIMLASNFIGFTPDLVHDDYEQEKIQFVQRWLGKFGPRDKNGHRQSLDSEQVAAVAQVGTHVQVIARAGSGKTTTIVNRAIFLIKHCGISASEMLLLAFNRKAAIEIRKRLLLALSSNALDALTDEIRNRQKSSRGGAKSLNDIEASAMDVVAERLGLSVPHVMTFHALAHSIVHPEDGILFDGTDGNEGQSLSRAVQGIIDDYLRDPGRQDRIRRLMMAHFKEDCERIIAGGYLKTKEDQLLYRRSLPRQCLNGDFVKSYGEKVIADFLFEHGIEYKYERNHWWNGTNYRPDFTIFRDPKTGVIIEYFGLSGDADYDEMSDAKRRYWSGKPDWVLLEYYPNDITGIGVDKFRSRLKASLEAQGITCQRLSDDEVWDLIKDRAIDRFTKAVVGFIGRCRKRGLSPVELHDLANRNQYSSDVEQQFLDVAQKIYRAYLNRISETGEDDFDGLMGRAADFVLAGTTIFLRRDVKGNLLTLRHIFIDEYQDFSYLFHRLITAIQEKNPNVRLFCVGDDWQAINGFAGSDLQYFRSFDEHVGVAKKLYISTNYRSAAGIVEVGNALMAGEGKPARANKNHRGEIRYASLDEFRPSIAEQQRHPGDAITPALARIAAKALENGHDVVFLARRNGVPWFVNRENLNQSASGELEALLQLVRSRFPDEQKKRITISTTHKYKGLEKAMVVILDAVERAYPLIHPDWVFTRVLGDSIEGVIEEDRRLFYVALTRAIESLVVITNSTSMSPFLKKAMNGNAIQKLNWNDYTPPLGNNSCIVVKIRSASEASDQGTYPIRHLLKAANYRWRSTGEKFWEKSLSVSGFSISKLQNEAWARIADKVEVHLCDEADAIIAQYIVSQGIWNCVRGDSSATAGKKSGRLASPF